MLPMQGNENDERENQSHFSSENATMHTSQSFSHPNKRSSAYTEQYSNLPDRQTTSSFPEEDWEVLDARPILPKAAFFMGDLRDGLSMVSQFEIRKALLC